MRREINNLIIINIINNNLLFILTFLNNTICDDEKVIFLHLLYFLHNLFNKKVIIQLFKLIHKNYLKPRAITACFQTKILIILIHFLTKEYKTAFDFDIIIHTKICTCQYN